MGVSIMTKSDQIDGLFVQLLTWLDSGWKGKIEKYSGKKSCATTGN